MQNYLHLHVKIFRQNLLLQNSVLKARPSSLKMEALQDFPKWTSHSPVVETEANLSKMLVLIFLLVVWCHIPEDSLFQHTWRFESSGAWRRVQWQIAAGVSESFAVPFSGYEQAMMSDRFVSYDIVYICRSWILSSWFSTGWVSMEDSWESVAHGIWMKRKILTLKLLLRVFLLATSYTPL